MSEEESFSNLPLYPNTVVLNKKAVLNMTTKGCPYDSKKGSRFLSERKIEIELKGMKGVK